MRSKCFFLYVELCSFILVIYCAGSTEQQLDADVTGENAVLIASEYADVTGADNPYMTANENLKMPADKDANVTGDENVDVTGGENANVTSDENVDVAGDENVDVTDDENANVRGDENANVTGVENAEVTVDEDANMTGDDNKANDHASAEDKNENQESSRKDLCKTAPGRVPDNKKIVGFNLSADQLAKFKIWPNGTIPFYIDSLSYDKILREKITDYLEEVTSVTGLMFTELSDPPKDEKERWVLFVNRRGQLECKDYSTNSFTNSGVQKVIIGYNCLINRGPISAIVLALAGVPPQHNAPNRDRFVSVSMDSILPDKRDLFKSLNKDDWLFNDLDYDVESVGHYPSYKYTADGSTTIKRKQMYGNRVVIQENEFFSCRDILKIKMLYKPLFKRKAKCNSVQKLLLPYGGMFRRPLTSQHAILSSIEK